MAALVLGSGLLAPPVAASPAAVDFRSYRLPYARWLELRLPRDWRERRVPDEPVSLPTVSFRAGDPPRFEARVVVLSKRALRAAGDLDGDEPASIRRLALRRAKEWLRLPEEVEVSVDRWRRPVGAEVLTFARSGGGKALEGAHLPGTMVVVDSFDELLVLGTHSSSETEDPDRRAFLQAMNGVNVVEPYPHASMPGLPRLRDGRFEWPDGSFSFALPRRLTMQPLPPDGLAWEIRRGKRPIQVLSVEVLAGQPEAGRLAEALRRQHATGPDAGARCRDLQVAGAPARWCRARSSAIFGRGARIEWLSFVRGDRGYVFHWQVPAGGDATPSALDDALRSLRFEDPVPPAAGAPRSR